MRFFCPQCHTPMNATGGISHVICPSCGLEINLELVDTRAGRSQLKLVADHTDTRIGPYLLHQCLGTGGMGSVYRATDTRNDREVAIKMLYPQLAALPHLLARFHREAQALEQLQDARIVRFIEAGEADGSHYIVMQYVTGQDLGKQLAHQPPDIPTALSVGQQVAEALAAAHAKGVVHRDLKPANVIVTPAGAVKVLDFGIAQFGATDHTLTHTDAMLGTFNYMSPEQRTGARAADHRSDLYALGVMLYLMTTGRLPIGALESPRRLNGAIGRDLERLLLDLLQNDPDRRPQSAAEVARTLEKLQRSAGIPPVVWAAAAMLTLALGVGALYAWGPAGSTPKNRLEPTKLSLSTIPGQRASLTQDAGLVQRGGTADGGLHSLAPPSAPGLTLVPDGGLDSGPPTVTAKRAPLRLDETAMRKAARKGASVRDARRSTKTPGKLSSKRAKRLKLSKRKRLRKSSAQSKLAPLPNTPAVQGKTQGKQGAQ